MESDSTSPRDLPPVRHCGSYQPGHDIHYIQARLSFGLGGGQWCTIRDVADDGTITFSDASDAWNHDPYRLRAVLAHCGTSVLLGAYGVLRLPTDRGAYCFSVRAEPDPCRAETGERRPGESLVDELLRRGGIVRRGRSVLAQLDE
jgi:hypothetical protein